MSAHGDDGESPTESPIDNSKTVINKIANLYAERLMSDVCLVVGDVEYPSHRLILCASSDVFQVMLMNPNWCEGQEPRVVLRETPSCSAVFEDFLRYLYTGRIQLEYATVIPLVSLADKYNVTDLLRLGLDFMSRNVSTACRKNQAVTWYQFAVAAGHSVVADLCRDFIKWNFSKVAETIDFQCMEAELLLGFLQCNDLVIEDEMALFKCVYKWLEFQREAMEQSGEENVDIHMDNYVNTVIPHIRFPMMSPTQLANLLLNPLSQSHTELLVDSIRIAMAFHNDQLTASMVNEARRRNDKLFTPRLYTTENHCASLSIDYLHNLLVYHCRSLLFSSQRTMRTQEDQTNEEQSEWVVDVYPKGVWFQRCLTVYRPPGLEVPERVLKTVRVSISTQSDLEQRVRIGILVVGQQDGFEHVRKVVSRNFFFSEEEQVVNFDDIVDYDDLNNYKQKSAFLSGPNKESFKISVVITPLTKLSSLAQS